MEKIKYSTGLIRKTFKFNKTSGQPLKVFKCYKTVEENVRKGRQFLENGEKNRLILGLSGKVVEFT